MPQHISFEQRLQLAASVLGISTLALALVLTFTFPSSAKLPDGFVTPIIAFEFAQTSEDLQFLTGDTPEAVRNRAQMDQGHQWDMVFPFAYASFLALLALCLGFQISRLKRQSNRYYTYAAAMLALSIIPFDLYENSILLAITDALARDLAVERLLESLVLATWLKWGAIGLILVYLSFGYGLAKHFVSALVCGVAALSVLVCWLSNTWPPAAESMTALISLCFVFLAIRSINQSVTNV